jgi:hypothetical protein
MSRLDHTKLQRLEAGGLELQLDGADVRYLRFGELEVVRRIYIAVRDVAWKTVPSRVRLLELAQHDDDGFLVNVSVDFTSPAIALTAEGTIAGRADGSLRYDLEMTPHHDFLYARIGLCILHPCELCAGRRYSTRTPAGVRSGRLGPHIEPQVLRDGVMYPLTASFSELEIDMDGVGARFAFEGDLFEIEDQRNWTDASFKTYSTQLALGLPHRAHAGEPVTQRMTMTCTGRPPARRPRPPEAEVAIGPATGRVLPPLGLGIASGVSLDHHHRELLSALQLDHLRVDLHLHDDDWQRTLLAGARDAEAIGAGLELAIHVDAPSRLRLQGVAETLQGIGGDRIRRVLVFHEGTETTPGPWVPEARRWLAPALPLVPFAGGTNLFFTEINRVRPHIETMDAVAWSINASVHATDDRSVMETLAPQGDQVISARAFAEDRKLFVGPVTLRMRWNAHARGGVDDPLEEGELPFPVDARQPTPFAAAWTLGSIGRLGRAGADALTYFETIGWRGLIETDDPRPETFPSTPGRPFPVYDVFAALAGWRGAELLAVTTADRLRADAIALRQGSAIRVLVANLTGDIEGVRLTGIRTGSARVQGPPWSEVTSTESRDGTLVLQLAPYGMAIVDTEAS